MFEFSKLCKSVEQMPPEIRNAVLAEKSATVLAALRAITDSDEHTVLIYLNFILCSIAADGKLDECEYRILQPAFEKAAGKEVSYEEAVAIFRQAGLDRPGEYKKAVDSMVDVLGMVSLDLKRDIITICLMVCAVDGKISGKEKKWIKQLWC